MGALYRDVGPGLYLRFSCWCGAGVAAEESASPPEQQGPAQQVPGGAGSPGGNVAPWLQGRQPGPGKRERAARQRQAAGAGEVCVRGAVPDDVVSCVTVGNWRAD